MVELFFDLRKGEVKFNNALPSISIDYKPDCALNIVHTGASIQFNFSPSSTLKGAHLSNEYVLAQFHLHWETDLKTSKINLTKT